METTTTNRSDDMNEFLANLYNTSENLGVDEASQTKLAEARMLDEALASEGVSIDDLDGETIMKVAYAMFGDESELVKEATKEEGEEGEEEEGEEDEEETKMAEADFLGRMMAHAYVDELNSLEKEAAAPAWVAGAGEKLRKAYEAAKGVPGAVGRKVTPKGVADRLQNRIVKKITKKMTGGKSLGSGMSSEMTRDAINKAILRGEKIRGGAALGAGAGALGAGGYGIKKALEKKGSAIDSLAEDRAIEILKEAGVVESNDEQKLAEAVEQRAWEMLVENGFTE